MISFSHFHASLCYVVLPFTKFLKQTLQDTEVDQSYSFKLLWQKMEIRKHLVQDERIVIKTAIDNNGTQNDNETVKSQFIFAPI